MDDTVLIAMVALRTAGLPKQKPFVAELRRRLEDNSLAGDLTKEGDILTFELGDDTATIELVNQPIPWSELEGPAAISWWWPEAAETLQGHTAHLVITLSGGLGTPLERFILLTHLTAAVVASTDAAGVFWPMGTIVHEPAMYLEYSEGVSPADIVPQLWFDMRVFEHDEGGYGFFTTGLAPLGLYEVEIDRTTRDPEDVFDFCQGIISYLVTSGEEIEPGETIGRTAEEQVPVRYADSQFDRGTVMKLDFT